MSDAMAVAAAAIRTAGNRVSMAANQIMRAGAASSVPVAPVDPSQSGSYHGVHIAMPTADLVEGMADLKQAELGFRAGIAAFKAADRMTRRTLDILT
jgi:flagellar basal body rod protein FlgC